MPDDVFGRIGADRASMPRATCLCLFFGKGMLVVDMLLAAAAIGAALVSLQVETDWFQQALFAAIMVVVPAILCLRSGRTSHEMNLQVLVSVTTYAVVWVAASGYRIANLAGPVVGTVRTALLYVTSVSILAAFALLLVRAALKNRQQYYCLGLALSTLLAGVLLPIIGVRFGYPLAHGFMAVGYALGFAIQRLQLLRAEANPATLGGVE